MSEGTVETWRTAPVLRALGWLWVFASGAATAATVAVALDPASSLLGALLLAFAVSAHAWWWYRMFLRPCLRSTADGVVICNPFSSCELAWRDIHRITPGRAGIEFARRQGPAAVAWAVQEGNLASVLRRRPRGPSVAAALATRAAAITGRDPAEYLGPH
jgi:hypothetical protein